MLTAFKSLSGTTKPGRIESPSLKIWRAQTTQVHGHFCENQQWPTLKAKLRAKMTSMAAGPWLPVLYKSKDLLSPHGHGGPFAPSLASNG
jgi:hypothetical protein